MDKICFLNNMENKYNGTIIKTSDTVIDITFIDIVPDDETLVSGFYIENEFNGKDMTGDYYYGYNTIYRKCDNELEIMLSNDGSIYVKPIIEPDVDNFSDLIVEDNIVEAINNEEN